MRLCQWTITIQANSQYLQHFLIWIQINVGQNVSSQTTITTRNSWRLYRNCRQSRLPRILKGHVLFLMGLPQHWLTPHCTTMRETLPSCYLLHCLSIHQTPCLQSSIRTMKHAGSFILEPPTSSLSLHFFLSEYHYDMQCKNDKCSAAKTLAGHKHMLVYEAISSQKPQLGMMWHGMALAHQAITDSR